MSTQTWKKRLAFVLGSIFILAVYGISDASGRFGQMTGWIFGRPAGIIPRASMAGFDEVVVNTKDPIKLAALVSEGQGHGVGVYAAIGIHDTSDWAERMPGVPAPMQKMNSAENAAFERIERDLAAKKAGYFQGGGEPLGDDSVEVLHMGLLCFNHPEVVTFLQKKVDAMLSVAGMIGVAFDFFGYQNYRCCRCSTCTGLFAKYQTQHPELPSAAALDSFSLHHLVAFNNDLSKYVYSSFPQAKIINHVYPVYLPKPLYGNRLDLDECGQTNAWFFEENWPISKIRTYSTTIFGEEKKYLPRPNGAAFVGYYGKTRRGHAPKTPERMEQELQAILDGGGDIVHVANLTDVLNNQQIADVFKRHYQPGIRNRVPITGGCNLHIAKSWPNPFNQSTHFHYSLGQESMASIGIYDIRGRLVRTLLSGRMAAGAHNVMWQGTDNAGKRVPAATYWCKLKAQSGEQRVVKMMLFE